MTHRSRCAFFAAALLATAPAHASSGPWTIGRGYYSLYGGVEAQRFTDLAALVGGEREVLTVGGAISTVGAKAVVSYGASDRIELEGSLPVYRVDGSRPDAGICAVLAGDSCAATTSPGILELRGKVLAIDQLAGAPLSLSAGLDTRFGALTAPTRGRVTNVGEGTLDVGPTLAVGRSGGLGAGDYSVYVQGRYLYRAPNTLTFPGADGERRAPGDEISVDSDLLLGTASGILFGPSGMLFSRPFGYRNLFATDLADVDRFAALAVFNVRAGGKVVIRSSPKTTVSASVYRTVASRNNPSDTWIVSVGMVAYGGGPRGG